MNLHCSISIIEKSKTSEINPESGLFAVLRQSKLLFNCVLEILSNLLGARVFEFCDLKRKLLKQLFHSVSVLLDSCHLYVLCLVASQIQVATRTVLGAGDYDSFSDLGDELSVRLRRLSIFIKQRNFDAWVSPLRKAPRGTISPILQVIGVGDWRILSS